MISELGSITRTASFWISRSTLSVTDQAMFAGANFAMTLFLAKILPPADFGAFAICYSIFLFAHGLQTAVILEPSSVIFAKKRLRSGPGVQAASLLLNTLLSLIFALSLGLSTAVTNETISAGLYGAAFATVPFWLFFFFRRMAYALNLAVCSCLGGAVYLSGIALGLLFIPAEAYSIETGFYLVSAAGLAAALTLHLSMRLMLGKPLFANPSRRMMAATAQTHFLYGKWNGPAAILGWLHSGIYLPVLGVLAGLEAAAAFRILQLFITPVLQVYVALELWLLPRFAALYRQHDRHAFRALTYTVAATCSVFAIIYIVVLFLFGTELSDSFFGPENKYSPHLWLTPYLLITLLARSAGTLPFGLILKSSGEFRLIFWAMLIGTLISGTFGMYMTFEFALIGAVLGTSATHIANASALIYAGQKHIAPEAVR